MRPCNAESSVTEERHVGEPEHPGTLIEEIQKNSRERLRITVDQFKGHEYIGIRIWFVGTDGQYRPSRSGVTLKPTLLPQLMQALGRAARAIDPRGAN
ncbi:hypothetical protein DIE02_27755 [Burkholderia sp. Bp8991]|nr:hypothetical protein DIE02_27755 [Burkholderia sp. Bp8991]